MKYLLATQGSQGVVALRELFAANIKPNDIHVAICENGVSGPLNEFIAYNKISYSSHESGKYFSSWLLNNDKKYDTLLSISWKYLFCDETIKYFAGSAINFHPGLLPDYRGCFSTPWSIINQEEYVGFTYHYISKNFDEGNILIKEKIRILNSDTAHSLNYRVFQRGLSKLIDVIYMIGEKGEIQSKGGSYYPNKLPFDGKIDQKWTVKQKNNFSRAMYFPPHEMSLKLIDKTNNK